MLILLNTDSHLSRSQSQPAEDEPRRRHTAVQMGHVSRKREPWVVISLTCAVQRAYHHGLGNDARDNTHVDIRYVLRSSNSADSSGFDQIMPETRGFPRFVPRTGARISITVGEPLTTQIQPLVDKWRGLARQESGTVGVGGKWEAEGNSPPGEKQRDIRESGYLSEGQEEAVRIQITSALQDGLQKLGQSVEEAEGRIASGEWCHSISKSQRGLVQ